MGSFREFVVGMLCKTVREFEFLVSYWLSFQSCKDWNLCSVNMDLCKPWCWQQAAGDGVCPCIWQIFSEILPNLQIYLKLFAAKGDMA